MSITLNQANRVLRAALKKAAELNIKVSAAVVDAGGRLVAFQRMDGAIWGSAYGSQGKAVASAGFGRPSGVMQERASQPTPAGINAASGGEMIMGQGAVPLFHNRHSGMSRRDRPGTHEHGPMIGTHLTDRPLACLCS